MKFGAIPFILITCMLATLNARSYSAEEHMSFEKKIQRILTSEKIIFSSSVYAELCFLISQKLAEDKGSSINENREIIALKLDALIAILSILSDRYGDIDLNSTPSINAVLPIINNVTGMTEKQRRTFVNDALKVNCFLRHFQQARALSQAALRLEDELVQQITEEYSPTAIKAIIIPLVQEKFDAAGPLLNGAFLPEDMIRKLTAIPDRRRSSTISPSEHERTVKTNKPDIEVKFTPVISSQKTAAGIRLEVVNRNAAKSLFIPVPKNLRQYFCTELKNKQSILISPLEEFTARINRVKAPRQGAHYIEIIPNASHVWFVQIPQQIRRDIYKLDEGNLQPTPAGKYLLSVTVMMPYSREKDKMQSCSENLAGTSIDVPITISPETLNKDIEKTYQMRFPE